MEASNFLFTWSPRVWPYEKLRALIDDFEAGRDAVEGWTCAAYRSIKKGDRAYVLKQGRGPCGVFGIAVVDGPARKSPDPRPGGGKYYVPLKFETLLDPTNGFLITKDGLLRLGAAASLLNTQKSGVTLKPAAIASVIDEIADKEGLTLDDFVQRMNAAKGQGRGLTGPERKLVENAAMRRAERWLDAEGFKFKNVSAVESCDFRARSRPLRALSCRRLMLKSQDLERPLLRNRRFAALLRSIAHERHHLGKPWPAASRSSAIATGRPTSW